MHEENRVAIPVLTPERAVKRQNGRRFKEDGEEAFTLTSQDRHGVAVSIEDFYHGLKVGVSVEQVNNNENDDMFIIDKGYKPEERDVANCIESREDRGLSKRRQEGTLICMKISKSQ